MDAGAVDERSLLRTDAPAFAAPARREAVAVPAEPPMVTRLVARAAAEADRERGRDLPFLAGVLSFGTGAWLYAELPFEPGWPALGAAVLVLVAGGLWLRRSGPMPMAIVAALALVLGVVAGKAETLRRATLMLGGAVNTTLTGRIVTIEPTARGRIRLVLDVVETAGPFLRHAPARVRLTTARLDAGAVPGALVRGRARLIAPTGPARPGGYDFSRRAYFDRIGASGFFLGAPAAIALPDDPGLVSRGMAAVETLRTRIAARVRARLPAEQGEIAAALMAGVQAGIPEELNEALRLSGLSHVLSISGLHMALVAGLFMGGLRLAFAFAPRFTERFAVKKISAILALCASLFYLFLSGAGVATQRSFLMIAVMLAAVLFDRAALSMRNLALAALVVLLVAPHEAAGPSFQLSFAATAALIALWAARPASPARASDRPVALRLVSGVARGAGALALTSIAAGVATSLIAAWHFQRAAPLGLVANLAAMPAVSFVVMPAGVGAMLMMPFGLDGPLLDLMGKGIAAMNAVAVWVAAHSPVDEVGQVRGPAVALFAAGLAVATMLVSRWRLAGLAAMAVAGLLAFLARDLPDGFVSEDARFVGIATSAGLALDRARGGDFVATQWRRALGVAAVLRPSKPGEGDGADMSQGRFVCREGICLLDHPRGFRVAHVDRAADAAGVCGRVALLVVSDPAEDRPCADPGTLTLTGRDLARQGAAEIRFTVAPDGTIHARAIHAIALPYRPWHRQRAFSRAARGMAERDQ